MLIEYASLRALEQQLFFHLIQARRVRVDQAELEDVHDNGHAGEAKLDAMAAEVHLSAEGCHVHGDHDDGLALGVEAVVEDACRRELHVQQRRQPLVRHVETQRGDRAAEWVLRLCREELDVLHRTGKIIKTHMFK